MSGKLGLRISIYNDPAGSGIGGSEFVAALLAEALAKNHHVDLFHRIPSLTREKLAANSGTDLNGVEFHYVRDETPAKLSRRNPWSHYRESRKTLANLSSSYDVFIAIVHDIPPFCHATRGALIVLFPSPTAPYINPSGGVSVKPAVTHPGRYLFQSWQWAKRMGSYEVKTAISEFSQRWAQTRWRVDCDVVYPPVDTNFRQVKKEKIIFSVGRFALEGEGHTKNQEEMLVSFRRIKEAKSIDWKYVCVGGLRETPEHKAYFEHLSTLTLPGDSQLIANIEWCELRKLYERASIFWHAAGYGQDENIRPDLAEHFGISTVEAMAAGCVPIVIKKGGQLEIVDHGVNGFLWETLDELMEYTDLLMNDDLLRAKMSEAARKRAGMFSRETFVANFISRLLPEATNAKKAS